MTQQEIQVLINEQWNTVHQCETNLRNFDYIGTKIAMGVATREDYAEEIAQTEQWRQGYRDAKAEIKRLEALEPEDQEPEDQKAKEAE